MLSMHHPRWRLVLLGIYHPSQWCLLWTLEIGGLTLMLCMKSAKKQMIVSTRINKNQMIWNHQELYRNEIKYERTISKWNQPIFYWKVNIVIKSRKTYEIFCSIEFGCMWSSDFSLCFFSCLYQSSNFPKLFNRKLFFQGHNCKEEDGTASFPIQFKSEKLALKALEQLKGVQLNGQDVTLTQSHKTK